MYKTELLEKKRKEKNKQICAVLALGQTPFCMGSYKNP